VDGKSKVAVRPPKTPIWWMARAKGQFVHENGRFGGWRRQKGSSSTKMADLVDGESKVNCAPKVGHKVKGYEKKRELPKVCPCDEALG
jgi:hypothetical protein